MNRASPRNIIKEILGTFPVSSEIYHTLRPKIVPPGSYALPQLAQKLQGWVSAVKSSGPLLAKDQSQRVLIVGMLKWWLEYGVVLGLLLKTTGHQVDLAFLPYRDWTSRTSRFDARRGMRYIQSCLGELKHALGLKSLLPERSSSNVPQALQREIETQSKLDVQYSLQREDVDIVNDPIAARIYRLRLQRNHDAAERAYTLLVDGDYDVVIIPNGSILEFGAVYRTARHLGVKAVTYEFGEQRNRMWLAQDSEVMRQDTTALWEAVKGKPLSVQQRNLIETLFHARRGGKTWEQFKRQWQSGESEGAQAIREKLKLDPNRPIVLLCTNVVGDSLALNRQVFTGGMADWLKDTVAFFEHHPEVQLVVRIHPGEMLGAGHPSVEIVKDALPAQPDHVTVVPPESEVNTYDLIGVAHLGLVYTTTVGLEMSMQGLPVIVAGDTHYRKKGFTDDPESWDEYYQIVRKRLDEPRNRRLEEERVEKAWRYAYRFFFDYPFPIPWHILSFWEDLDTTSLEEILDASRMEEYRDTLMAFTGHPIDWSRKAVTEKVEEETVER